MKNEMNIGDIFKQGLQDNKAPVHSEEWDELAIKLDRMKFYRFSFSHFNIYYSSLILICVLSTAFMVGRMINSEDPKPREKYYSSSMDTITPEVDSIAFNQSKKNPDKNSIKQKFEEDKKAKPIQTESNHQIRKEKTPEGIDDTLYIKKEKVSLPKDSDLTQKNIPEKKPQIKKVVHVVKQDTIVVLDTLEKKLSKGKIIY